MLETVEKMEKYDIKCDNCGKFIPYDDIKNKKTSYLFIPSSQVSYEEEYHRCKKCTKLHGKPISKQFCCV